MVTAALETAADMHLPSEEAARTCQPKVCSVVKKLHRDGKAWLGIAIGMTTKEQERTRNVTCTLLELQPCMKSKSRTCQALCAIYNFSLYPIVSLSRSFVS